MTDSTSQPEPVDRDRGPGLDPPPDADPEDSAQPTEDPDRDRQPEVDSAAG
jgi:hypothetical protein